jgi:hypothetical protein
MPVQERVGDWQLFAGCEFGSLAAKGSTGCIPARRPAKLDDRFRLAVIRLFDLPAPFRSFKVQAVGRQCGNEIDKWSTRTRP